MTFLVRSGVASGVVLLALLVPTAAVAKPKPKLPDLVVKTLPLQGQPYAVNGEAADSKTTFEFAAFNRGNKATGHKTLARLQIVHPIRGPFKFGYAEIPPVKKDAGQQVKATTPVTRQAAGAYRVRACADIPNRIKESNENNNCSYFTTTEPHFYVVNSHYRGTVSGIQDRTSEGGWIESWNMPAADFGPATYLGGGTFSYALSGSVYYTDSGGNGCTVTGSGVAAASGDLDLQFETGRYFGTGTGETSYPIFKCGNNDDGETGPVETRILETFSDTLVFPALDFGNAIGGGVSEGDNESWTWSLTGADD
jgi:hypothetical protein